MTHTKNGSKDPAWVGIHPHGKGYLAVVSHGRSRRTTRYFPKETTPAVMQGWRADTKAHIRVTRKRRALAGTLEVDARRYLNAVRALPDYRGRCDQIAVWVAALGHRHRDDLTPGEIRQYRDQWLTEPRSDTDTRPLGASTVNKRLRALSNLYRVLDGKQHYNPVRDVDEAHEPTPVAHAMDYQTIERIIGAMKISRAGQWKRQPPPDWRPAHPSLSPVRARILAYTGLSLSSLKRVRLGDVDLEHQLLRLPARKKGRGVAAQFVPLLPPAAEAFRELAKRHGFGRFDNRTLRRAFTTAAVRVGVGKVRLHDLRHSLGTIAYELTGSLEVVMALLQHTSAATTKRYTMAAALRVLQQQTAPLHQHFDGPRVVPIRTPVADQGAVKNVVTETYHRQLSH